MTKRRFKFTVEFEGDLDMIPGWGYTETDFHDLAMANFIRPAPGNTYNLSARVIETTVDGKGEISNDTTNGLLWNLIEEVTAWEGGVIDSIKKSEALNGAVAHLKAAGIEVPAEWIEDDEEGEE